jgi:4-amino-4-deoxy-L-arabinose transferase-like glycosyltransferase
VTVRLRQSRTPSWLALTCARGRAPLVAAALTVLLRLPGLLEPHHYGDEGIFAAVARQLLRGDVLYAQVWDDKPPLVFWLYASVLALFGPSMLALRLLAMLWAVATVLAAVALATRLASPRAVWIAGITCALVISTPLIEANLALTELFASAPVAWAFVLLAGRSQGTSEQPAGLSGWLLRHGPYLGAGALLAVGLLFKQVMALDAVAAGVFVVLAARPVLPKLAALVGGYAVPVVLTAALLAVQGALDDGLYAAFGFYRVYLAEGSGLPPLFTAAKLAPALLAIALAMLATRHASRSGTALAVLWLGFAATGAVLGGRPFGHYLVQVVAPASVAPGLLCSAIAPRQRLVLVSGMAVACYVIFSAFNRYWYSYEMVRLAYYHNAALYVAGNRSRAEYEGFFSWRVAHQRAFASIIRADDERTLFVWGEYPWLYPLADADSATRYVTSYHTSFVPDAKTDVIAALNALPPRYIVWERDEWRRLPGLADLVAARYQRVSTAGNSELYRRND